MQNPSLELLQPEVQKVVLDRGWSCLYPIQEDAIRHFLQQDSDFVVAAPTSGGKTEAIFLPLLSELVRRPIGKLASVRVLCISPLKALINDQFARLSNLCEPLGIAVHRWHGDVDSETKRRLRERPCGILFITPESVESCFLNYSHQVQHMFQNLEYVVLDEVHTLLETERGMHIKSLLARLEAAIQRRPRRFGLSATLGDPFAARSFLNAQNPDSVHIITDRSTARPIEIEVVTVSGNADPETTPNPTGVAGGNPNPKNNGTTGPLATIAEDIRRTFQDGSYLIFANSRRLVEELGDYFLDEGELASDAEPAVVLHHGSLSARVRRQTESMLKSGAPTRAFCTSSLELGIDIGAVEAVAQIDPTWSVASMVQRLGRSGRTPGSTSQLRLYVRAPVLTAQSSLVDLLCPALLQSVAMVNLLLAGWLEPAAADRMHLSTLVHQIFSVLKQTGGQTALELYRTLCRQGPFCKVLPADFKCLLQGLRTHDLLNQNADGDVFLSLPAERIVSAPGFYAAFSTPVELSVRCGAKELGRLPVSFALKEGECLLLNGRRWLIESIDWIARSVWVSPTATKQPPLFLGGTGEINDRILEEMRSVLIGAEEPDWLDATSINLLRSARETACRVGLQESGLLDLDEGVQWFPWVGTRTMRTLQLWAKKNGDRCAKDALSLNFRGLSKGDLEQRLTELVNEGVEALELAALMPSKQVERFDHFVEEQLLNRANAIDRLDVRGAREAARATLNRRHSEDF